MPTSRSASGSTLFWGKAHPEPEGGTEVHPLSAHSMDVAAVAVLLSRRLPGLDPRLLGFLVSLHDIGKFSRPFQAKVPAAWPAAVLGPYLANTVPQGPRHDFAGVQLLSTVLADHLNDLLPPGTRGARGWDYGKRSLLWRALAGHHGRPPADPVYPGLPDTVVCGGCIAAATRHIAAMRTLFQPPSWTGGVREREVVLLSWALADWFPYVPASAVDDPGAYFRGHALPRAAAALAEAGLTVAAPAPFAGIRGLFPNIAQPTPIQVWAETEPLPAGPTLAVIEDLTGSGKTEAALTLAHRLLAAGRADGIYFALPTMATASAMFGRLSDSYRALFAADARPSLALAHGRAALDPRFAAAIAGAGASRPEPTPAATGDPADEPAESHCASWLAADSRRALLAQVGVGTLDQALLGVRHAALRLQGITGKVLVVDEVHAFDPYMREVLATLLRFQAALGGSAILLSATLPQALRQQLVDAFRDGLGRPASVLVRTDYPLATITGADAPRETPCAPRDKSGRRVTVTRLPDAAAAVGRIVAAASAGAATVWIRNTVDDAIDAVALLRAQNIEPLLFHARFAMADRLRIEQEVLRLFGRDSTTAMRNRVLVATPVVEQSLDLDFDVMVTDLAPADLLIQRAGRLWRHQRDDRRGLTGPELLVISPAPVDAPAADWIRAVLPGTGWVHRDHALLWRSARAIFGRGALVTPDDMRLIIEAAADRDAPGAVPPALASSDDGAYGKELGLIGLAAQNVLELGDGYADRKGTWNSETRTPTRIEDRPHVTLRLAVLREGAIVPYATDEDPARAWALSEVAVAHFRIASCPVPAGLQAAADRARAGWGRWERQSPFVILAVLTPDGDAYRLDANRASGAAIAARYDGHTGLSWPRPVDA
ncbi:MAG: CRISPR-associated helicase Cas3' [Azospirillaceae bacterium]|nr:CRISPR-associated helicase Cas3' [Azospirillaceae bacterium]